MGVTQFKTGVPGGGNTPADRYSVTGYLCKKMVHYLTSVPDNSAKISAYRYAFPIIRLADLYLMYSEASNEWKDAPRSEEHTSELQSLMRISYAVFCLKKINNNHTNTIHYINNIPHIITTLIMNQ